MKTALRVFLVALLAGAMLAGCSTTKTKSENMQEAALYKKVQDSLLIANYSDAVTYLNSLVSRFPFGQYADQARLDLIYAYYMQHDTDSTVDAADRFIRENPRHPNVDYAYYMKGLAYFEINPNPIQQLFNVEMTRRDPTNARKSFQAFQVLVQKFPDSRYAVDAHQRMVYLRDRLAKYEWMVAQYYMKIGAYVAAVDRAQYVVDHYPDSTSTENALKVIVQAYQQMGMTDLARDAERVVEANVGSKPQPATVADNAPAAPPQIVGSR